MKRLPILAVRWVGVALLLGAAACTSATSDDYYDACDAAVPAAECYASRRDPQSEEVATATEIALAYIDQHPPEEELWDWKSGVLMYGLTELYRVTGDTRIRDYYKTWLDYRIEEGYEIVWSDSCPPALTAIALLQEASTDAYQQVVDDVLEYLDGTAPRTDQGGISHNGVLGNRPSVWVDSLFMFGMVLNRYGELADPSRLDMYSEQVLIFADLLQDENGFMRHAQNWPGYEEALYWARGNAWVVASLSDYLRIRVEREEEDSAVEAVFRSLLTAVLDAQDEETGLWWSIMDRPGEIYTETSASALYAYGVARAYRYGVVGDAELAAARRAIEGVKTRIREDASGPSVTGISLATDPWSFEEYAAVPLDEDVNYGIGAVILALIETSGLPN